MSFRVIPKINTSLSEIGWQAYPIDDGNIVYSTYEVYRALKSVQDYVKSVVPSPVNVDSCLFIKIWRNGLLFENKLIF